MDYSKNGPKREIWPNLKTSYTYITLIHYLYFYNFIIVKIMISLCKSCLLVISIYSTRLGEEEEERGREGS